jgi:hypothetical protein
MPSPADKLARSLDRHMRHRAERATSRVSNEIGRVVGSDGKGHVRVFLPGSQVTIDEHDLSFVHVDPVDLEEGDELALMARGNEYVVVGQPVDKGAPRILRVEGAQLKVEGGALKASLDDGETWKTVKLE